MTFFFNTISFILNFSWEGEVLKIKVSLLKKGYVLSDDVYSVSNKPIAKKNTVIEEKHIEVFKAFLIKEVDVKRNSSTVNESVKEEKLLMEEETSSFKQLYIDVVKKYKKMFLLWQSGSSVDIQKVRELILPLVDKALSEPMEVMGIYKKCEGNEYIYHHSIAVATLCAIMAKELNYTKGEIYQIALAGFLSDCGMSKINSRILQKKGVLTQQEYHEVKQHPILSYKMLKDLTLLKDATKISVLQHHERLDGSGYPLSFKGEKLHPFGRIVSLADTYQAMISDRPYRTRISPFYTLDSIEKDEFGRFDLTVLKALKKLFANYMKGRKIGFSNGRIGEIVFIDENSPTKPFVSFNDSKDVIALSKKDLLHIEEVF